MLQLKNFQAEDIAILQPRDRAIIGHEQGLGKSVIGSKLAVAGTIVVCPSHARLGWDKHLRLWRPDLKRQVIRKRTDKLADDTEVVIISYDMLKHVELPVPHILIVDESHYCKNKEAIRSQEVAKLAQYAGKVYLLSGTPMPNRTRELWTQLRILGATDLDYFEFTTRYSNGRSVQRTIKYRLKTGGYGRKTVKTWDDTGSSNVEELEQIVSKVMVRRLKSDVLSELPEKQFESVPLIGGRVSKADRDVADKMYKAITTGNKAPRVAFDKLSSARVELGQKKVDPSIEYIKDVLESTDKVIVFAWHTDVIDRLKTELAEFNPVSITGSDSLDAKQAAEERFQTDPECRVIIGNIIAMGTHWTLTAASRVIFVELDWVPGNLMQASDRAHRIGQDEQVLVSFIVFENTIEEAFINALIDKELLIGDVIKPSEVAA